MVIMFNALSVYAILLLLFGRFNYAAIQDHGIEAMAKIVATSSRSPSIALVWYDKTGVERYHRLIPISQDFWHSISVKGILVVPEVKIKYLEDNSWATPVIVDDPRERNFSLGIVAGIGLLGFGVALAIKLRRRIRAWSEGRAAAHN
jgi:hypothetical protein